jgi:hypothetical protein
MLMGMLLLVLNTSCHISVAQRGVKDRNEGRRAKSEV